MADELYRKLSDPRTSTACSHEEALMDLLSASAIPSKVEICVDFIKSLEGTAELDKIKVPTELRGKGVALRVLEIACDYFDTQSLSIGLSVRPLDECTDKLRLISLYSRFGFCLGTSDVSGENRMTRLHRNK